MDWPNLMAIIEDKVRPGRSKDNRASYRVYWWQFAEKRLDLQIGPCGTQPRPVSRLYVPTPTVCILAEWNGLCRTPQCVHADYLCRILHSQSRPHEIWARFFGSSLEDRLRYTSSDCFETFPFPDSWETHPSLEATGKAYYEYRAVLMVRNDEGMHARPTTASTTLREQPDIEKLRELHAAMDRAVLDAYGWTDIPTDCDFLLDYEIDEATWGRKKSRTATAGRTPSETRYSPASLPSTRNAPPRKPVLAHRRLIPYKPNRSPQDRQQ